MGSLSSADVVDTSIVILGRRFSPMTSLAQTHFVWKFTSVMSNEGRDCMNTLISIMK